MTLLTVHKLMIGMAVVFCAGFGVRGLVLAARGGGAPTLILGAAFSLFTVGLAVYLRWLLRTKGAALARAGRGGDPDRPAGSTSPAPPSDP